MNYEKMRCENEKIYQIMSSVCFYRITVYYFIVYALKCIGKRNGREQQWSW